ncbi:MAG: hypothetical protein R3Y16_01190 [Rikenellaceae bacterium]
MTGDLVITILKHIGVSAILFSLYIYFVKSRAGLLERRIYLLLIPLLSAYAAYVSIDLIKVKKDNGVGQLLTKIEEVDDDIRDVVNNKKLPRARP